MPSFVVTAAKHISQNQSVLARQSRRAEQRALVRLRLEADFADSFL
jgi:hypothetical protein